VTWSLATAPVEIASAYSPSCRVVPGGSVETTPLQPLLRQLDLMPPCEQAIGLLEESNCM
jgi:hypothetical protein